MTVQTITTCDRCKATSADPSALWRKTTLPPSTTPVDLCPNCIRELKRWMETPPPREHA